MQLIRIKAVTRGFHFLKIAKWEILLSGNATYGHAIIRSGFFKVLVVLSSAICYFIKMYCILAAEYFRNARHMSYMSDCMGDLLYDIYHWWVSWENIPAINISYIFVSMTTELLFFANLWQTKVIVMSGWNFTSLKIFNLISIKDLFMFCFSSVKAYFCLTKSVSIYKKI